MSKTSKALTAYLDCRPPGGQSRARVGQKSKSLRTGAGFPLLTVIRSYRKLPEGWGSVINPQCPGDAQHTGTASNRN